MIEIIKLLIDDNHKLELVCIDKESFINSKQGNKEILENKIVIDKIEDNCILINNDPNVYISPFELKFFNIKIDKPAGINLLKLIIQRAVLEDMRDGFNGFKLNERGK